MKKVGRARGQSNEKILIVEDLECNRDLLVQFLEDMEVALFVQRA